MPRLPIYHALSHQRASTDDRFAKEKGQCRFRGAVTKQRHGFGLLGPVCQASSTSADYVIPLFTRVFNTYGTPEKIKSANGPPFNGSKFANFAHEQGFRHRKVTPELAEANGDVERFMQTLKKSARISKLEGKAIREGVQRTVGSYRATPHPATKESPDMLMFGRELRRKLPERIVPAGEIPYDPIRQRDAAKKKQMKDYADKRRNARESLIVVGDQVLLKQSKADVLTPAFDPRPFSVIGVKGSMVTVKRGREIKSRYSSHCKLLKHAREDEYVAVDLDQEGLDTSSAEETETGAREDLRLQPDNLGASSEMTIGGPRNEPDGPPTSLGATETEGHQQQPDDTAVSGQEDQRVQERLPGTLFTGTLSYTRKKGGDVL